MPSRFAYWPPDHVVVFAGASSRITPAEAREGALCLLRRREGWPSSCLRDRPHPEPLRRGAKRFACPQCGCRRFQTIVSAPSTSPPGVNCSRPRSPTATMLWHGTLPAREDRLEPRVISSIVGRFLPTTSDRCSTSWGPPNGWMTARAGARWCSLAERTSPIPLRFVSGPPGSSKRLRAFTRTDAAGAGASAGCCEVVVESGLAAGPIAERCTGL